MCGIVYAYRKDGKPVKHQVLQAYKAQDHRGNEGFGYIAIEGITGSGRALGVAEYKRTQTEEGIKGALKKCDSPHILFHHRYPTSTINVPESAHPIVVEHDELKYTYYVAHNGVISNPSELHGEHKKLGYKYSTEIATTYRTACGTEYTGDVDFNDSESLAIELARTIEGLQPSVKALGTIAYIVLQTLNGRVIATYYGTNGGNPLTTRKIKGGVLIASEGGERITDGQCYRLDHATGNTTTVALTVNIYQTYSQKYSYAKPYSLGFKDKDAGKEDSSPSGKVVRYPDEYQSIYDQEDILERIDDINNDLKVAEQAQEWEEVEDLLSEREALQADLRELKEAYANEF